MKKVFLGGTCNDSKWREQLIPMLKIDYFNPVVDDWTEEHQAEEIRQRNECDFCLYVITPKMTGVYAIAEAVQDSNRKPEKTLFCVLERDADKAFDKGQLMSLMAVSNLIKSNGAKIFNTLEAVAEELNKSYVEIPYNPNLIECLIERDGPTEIRLGKSTYLFEKNEAGDYVCEVLSAEHRRHLLSLPDFRVYQEENLSEPEFTDEEYDFIREWRTLSSDNFLAYVNGHITRFTESRGKIRDMAVEKWRALLSNMDCPIHCDEDNPDTQDEGNQHAEQAPLEATDPSGDDELTAFDRAFWKEWRGLNGPNFKEYVEKNEQRFLDAPDFLWDKAIEKWQRLITDKTGEPWPFEEGEEDE